MRRAHDSSLGFCLSDVEKQYLIEVVEQRSLLWNDTDVNYKNLHARAKAWRDVTRDMSLAFERNFDAESLQKSFKNLRDVYVRKRRDFQEALRRKSGSEAGTLERIKSWPFYNSLQFSDAVNDQGERFSNVEMAENVVEDVGVVVEDVENIVDLENISASESLDMLTRQSTPVSRQSTPASTPRQPTPAPVRCAATNSITRKSDKKQTKSSAEEHFASVLKENFENLDRFESMGELIFRAIAAAKLRELWKVNAVRAEELFIKIDEIQLAISKAMYDSIKEKSE